jgi:hypothetical protein
VIASSRKLERRTSAIHHGPDVTIVIRFCGGWKKLGKKQGEARDSQARLRKERGLGGSVGNREGALRNPNKREKSTGANTLSLFCFCVEKAALVYVPQGLSLFGIRNRHSFMHDLHQSRA